MTNRTAICVISRSETREWFARYRARNRPGKGKLDCRRVGESELIGTQPGQETTRPRGAASYARINRQTRERLRPAGYIGSREAGPQSRQARRAQRKAKNDPIHVSTSSG